ncbi:hypothetical protein I4U23_003561 [Adineta vaga]|nr:hypothetical protein I4U23_003561 [Adineta vaga]
MPLDTFLLPSSADIGQQEYQLSMTSIPTHNHLIKDQKNISARMIIVANRLPITMTIKSKRDGQSEVEFLSSSGGVASALTGISNLWIGWPGGEVRNAEDRKNVTEKLQAIKSHDKRYLAYQDANAQFAKIVLDNYDDGDIVWIHDYHLMLVPSLLRRAKPQMKIGFFFHTPFPCGEVYCTLPSRSELLLGVLNSNLIGFHTDQYLRHFQSAVSRLLNVEYDNNQIRMQDIMSRLGVYPIGIDARKFVDTVASDSCQEYVNELKLHFAGRKVLLGIDRLDYIKGILQKMLALELFFENHPEWIGKVILVQVAVPSRTDVLEYQMFKAETHKLVGRINGRFGSVANVPICYLDQSMPFEKMCALYHCADVMMVTSIRDGMNLVSYEYIACQKDSTGVLILSEFCGAAELLDGGVLQINPWNINDVANAIYKALTMTENERRKLSDIACNYVMGHTAKNWATKFYEKLKHQEFVSTNVSQPIHRNASRDINEKISKSLNMEMTLSKFNSDQRELLITSLVDLIHRVEALSPTTIDDTNEKDTCISRSQYQDVGELWGWRKSSATNSDTSNKVSSVLDSCESIHKNIATLEKTLSDKNNNDECFTVDDNNNLSDNNSSNSNDSVRWFKVGSTILSVFKNLIKEINHD